MTKSNWIEREKANWFKDKPKKRKSKTSKCEKKLLKDSVKVIGGLALLSVGVAVAKDILD